jgi:DNA mismatch endonuclease, patch repair protein
MADVHDIATRSYNMSQIKGKNTKPEMLVRKFLHANGFRYRLHVKSLPGNPDIVLPKYNTVIEVHGCYFHRHKNCKYCTTPSKASKTDWEKKFEGTINRDKKNKKALKSLGWRVITVWECQTRPNKFTKTQKNLLKKLYNKSIRPAKK